MPTFTNGPSGGYLSVAGSGSPGRWSKTLTGGFPVYLVHRDLGISSAMPDYTFTCTVSGLPSGWVCEVTPSVQGTIQDWIPDLVPDNFALVSGLDTLTNDWGWAVVENDWFGVVTVLEEGDSFTVSTPNDYFPDSIYSTRGKFQSVIKIECMAYDPEMPLNAREYRRTLCILSFVARKGVEATYVTMSSPGGTGATTHAKYGENPSIGMGIMALPDSPFAGLHDIVLLIDDDFMLISNPLSPDYFSYGPGAYTTRDPVTNLPPWPPTIPGLGEIVCLDSPPIDLPHTTARVEGYEFYISPTGTFYGYRLVVDPDDVPPGGYSEEINFRLTWHSGYDPELYPGAVFSYDFKVNVFIGKEPLTGGGWVIGYIPAG